jgi:fatty acid desaturase
MDKWIINGNEYDLEDYLKYHPGGDISILLGKGRDCSQLIRSYHPNLKKVCAVLNKEKYRGNNPKIDTIGDPDPLHEELHQMAQKYKNNYGTIKMDLCRIILVIILFLVNIFWWIQFFNLNAWAMVMLPAFTWISNIHLTHAGCHFAVSTNSTVNYISGLMACPFYYNSIGWYFQHNVSHHIESNEENDIDITHLEPFARYMPFKPWKKNHYYNVFFTSLLFIFSSIGATIKQPIQFMINPDSLWEIIPNKRFLINKYKLSLFIQLCVSIGVTVYPIFFFPNWYGIMYSSIMRITASTIFTLITTVSHIQEECSVQYLDKFWSQRQILHSVDYNVDSLFWNIITAGLNTQSIHHVLPYVHECHYPTMYPEYVYICRKYGITPNIKNGFGDALYGFFSWMSRLSSKDIKVNVQ